MKSIQSQLKAPKGQFNSFGKYKYRSCEDIVEAVKPLLAQVGYHLILSDDIIAIGDRIYVKATATVYNGADILGIASAFAREPSDKKGMDASQITGTASSYARKYALNGLFAIDDTKDADSTNDHKDEVGEEKRMKLIALLENTIWDESLKSKTAIKISAYTTNEQYDKAYRIILANQKQ